MNVFLINGGVFGSTGKILHGIAESCLKNGNEFLVASPITSTNRYIEPNFDYYKIGTYPSRKISVLFSRITGLSGCFSVFSTYKLIRKLKWFKPDVIHIHTLHESFINLPIFFMYIKSHDIPVIWTLHDCWTFTGHCTYFTLGKCDNWKNGCYYCPQYRDYPKSLFDNSRFMWKLKKKWFTGIETMTIVTPSQWLADLVKQSFLKNYPTQVITNGIDLSVFKPTPSNFREKYEIPQDIFIILGVAFGWEVRKGLDVFVELSKRLNSSKFKIVLVGTDGKIDKHLPPNIISIHRTQDQQELAEIYTAAELFINPTREEALGLVNLEALACGTPGITFCTGGSPECYDETCGSVIDVDDIDGLEREIIRVCEERPYSSASCLKRAQLFDQNIKYQEYVELYRSIYDSTSES